MVKKPAIINEKIYHIFENNKLIIHFLLQTSLLIFQNLSPKTTGNSYFNTILNNKDMKQ